MVEYDAEAIEPVVARPHTVDNVAPVRDVAGTRIDQAFPGTCTNGRLSDLAMAAQVLEGRKVASGVRLIVIPASSEVYLDALEKGDEIEVDLQAGEIRSAKGTFTFPPLPEAVMGIFEAGGLIPYTRKRLGIEG